MVTQELILKFKIEDKIECILEEFLSDEICNKCSGTGERINNRSGKNESCGNCFGKGMVTKWKAKKIDVPFKVKQLKIDQYINEIFHIQYGIAQEPYDNTKIFSDGNDLFPTTLEGIIELNARNEKIDQNNQ